MESKASPRDIFNLPIFEFYWILDLRPEADFKKGNICSSFSFPYDQLPSSEVERAKLLSSFIWTQLDIGILPPENFSPVVLYGDGSPGCSEAISWMVGQLQRLKLKKTQLTLYIPETASQADSGEQRSRFERFIDRIVSETSAVWVLEGGYASFHAKYPFLCHIPSLMDLYPLPHEIEDRVYLGSRPMNLSRCLKDLSISHLILSTDKYKKLLSQSDAESLAKVNILNIDMNQFSEDNVLQLWKSCHEFINSALLSHSSSVLVLFEGRSRSASILISWLVSARGYTIQTAIDYVKSIAPAVDTSLIFASYLEVLLN